MELGRFWWWVVLVLVQFGINGFGTFLVMGGVSFGSIWY
jgi:hypothetical protein